MPSGYYKRKEKHRKYHYSDALKEKIRKEYLNGALTIDLSKKHSISMYTMHKTILKGLKKHNKQKPLFQVKLNLNRDFYEVLGLIIGDGYISKYVVGYDSIDKELIYFVVNATKKYGCNPHVYISQGKKNKLCTSKRIQYELKIYSIDFASKVKKEMCNIERLKGKNLIGFVDGLMSAEGGINNTINFAQNEPNFTKYLIIIRKLLGKENNITINQTGCKQAHWSPFDLKNKPIFTHCKRKLDKLHNCKQKKSFNTTRNKVISFLSDKKNYSLKEIQTFVGNKSGGSLFKLLEKMIIEKSVEKTKLNKFKFGRQLVQYNIANGW